MSSSADPIALVVLISGNGSNLQAIIDACAGASLNARVAAVISNRADAFGLTRARKANIPARIIDHAAFPSRDAYDIALIELIDEYAPALVVLAGFMRVLGSDFVRHYAGRLMNVHPSLLPKYRGLNTHARVLQAGDSEHGVSVHFVTEDLDAGPIISQVRIPVRPDDSADSLAQRVHEQEHRVYPCAIQWFADGRLRIEDSRVLLDGRRHPEQGLVDGMATLKAET